MLLRASTVLSLLVLLGSNSHLAAQNRLWRSAQSKPLTQFDWNCADTSWHPTRRVSNIVQVALRRQGDGPPRYADRAFAFDLNGDGTDELFVPLTCGATGNCGWALLTTDRRRLLGIIGGQYFYVHRLRGRWPVIITYGHLSAVEGSLSTYHFRDNRYVASKHTYAINHGDYDLDIQGGLGHKMPVFLQRARPGCRTLDY
jgi:hypothetical protein